MIYKFLVDTDSQDNTPTDLAVIPKSRIPSVEYDEGMCDTAIRELSNGRTLNQLCKTLRVGDWKMRAWRKLYPEFDEAVRYGICMSEAWWTEKCQDNLENKKFNNGLFYLYMGNRFNWAARNDQNSDRDIQITIKYEGVGAAQGLYGPDPTHWAKKLDATHVEANRLEAVPASQVPETDPGGGEAVQRFEVREAVREDAPW